MSVRRPSRFATVLLVLLRLIGLLVATELSGAVHAALDVTASLIDGEHPDDDCGDEAGHECPPGCPNCHCTHGAVGWAVPGVVVVSTRAIQPVLDEAGFVPLHVMPPASPDLNRLYRPPRAVALS